MYARAIQPSLSALPESVRDQASRSIGDTYVVLRGLAETDPAAAQKAGQEFLCEAGQACAAGQAYLTGVHVTAVIAACFALAGAAVVLRYLPRKGMAVSYTRSAPDSEPSALSAE